MLEVDFTLLTPTSDLGNVLKPQHHDMWSGALLHPDRIADIETGDPKLSFCKSCKGALKKDKVPALSMVNMNYLGPVPEELSSLTVIEESMVALCHTKCMVVQLKDDSETMSKKHLRQRDTVGHMIMYPQHPGAIAEMLLANNPLYKNICFNEEVLQQLDRDPVLPIHIQQVIPSKATLDSTSQYDNIDLENFLIPEDDIETDAIPIPDVMPAACLSM
ncbi:uncharacterized protein ARMOST_22197 [Armillaria ostoyae]|uniref:DUF6570 domain-containing protein n=1 Tax=Armillaria ostoyae TaxID=47428 RepID=A0A284SC84_ARMOS|nr:uncharacterized protein ARMOST_22197 [Armillaria ostoyae]